MVQAVDHRRRSTTNPIYANTRQQIWGAWLVALIWNGVIGYIIIKGGERILRVFEEEPVFYFLVLFPIFGVVLLSTAIRKTWAGFKFGRIPLILEPFPARLDQAIAGHVTLPAAISKIAPAALTLTCFHEYVDEGEHRSEPLWQDGCTAHPQPDGSGTRFGFNFKPPTHLPGSSKQGSEKYRWELHLRMPSPGIALECLFKLPVESALLNPDGVNPIDCSKNFPRSEAESTRSTTIPEVINTPGGVQFYYGYGRFKLLALIIFLLSLLIGGFGFLMYRKAEGFLPVTMTFVSGLPVLIAAMMLLIAIFMVVHVMTIEVGLNGVLKKQKIFGFELSEHTPAKDIADIIVDTNGSMTNGSRTQIWYCLKLVTCDGLKIEVGDTLENYSAAQSVRERMIGALGSNWLPSAPTAERPLKNKLPVPVWFVRLSRLGKILKYCFVLALMYDLSPWILKVFKL